MSASTIATHTKKVPSPGHLTALPATLAFQREPLHFMAQLLQQYGDIVNLPLLGMPMVLINHPDDIKRVLQDNHMNYDKDAAIFRLVHPLLGDGLITAIGGESWMSRRRLLQPSFHRQRIAQMAQVMLHHTMDMLATWDMYAAEKRVINVGKEMSQLTLRIVARTLFAFDIGPQGASHPYAQALDVMMKELAAFLRFPVLPLRVPTPGHRRFWKNIQIMDSFVYDMIRVYREGKKEDQGDLLYMMMQAQDEKTGEHMNDKQLRDEVTNFLFAGHETSANGLTWTLHMLTQHPEIEGRLREELARVLSDRLPTMEDLPKLTYLSAVVQENLRLNPPIWQLMRHARQDDELSGYHIPAGTNLFWSPYLVHRHQDFWPDAETFNPDRFRPDCIQGIHKGAFIPFSSGPRMCIGNNFAQAEMQLVLASILQRYYVKSCTEANVGRSPGISLWPDKPVQIILERH